MITFLAHKEGIRIEVVQHPIVYRFSYDRLMIRCGDAEFWGGAEGGSTKGNRHHKKSVHRVHQIIPMRATPTRRHVGQTTRRQGRRPSLTPGWRVGSTQMQSGAVAASLSREFRATPTRFIKTDTPIVCGHVRMCLRTAERGGHPTTCTKYPPRVQPPSFDMHI